MKFYIIIGRFFLLSQFSSYLGIFEVLFNLSFNSEKYNKMLKMLGIVSLCRAHIVHIKKKNAKWLDEGNNHEDEEW